MRKPSSSAVSFSDFDHSETPGGWNPLTLAALAALWIASVCNWPLWRAMGALSELNSARGMLFRELPRAAPAHRLRLRLAARGEHHRPRVLFLRFKVITKKLMQVNLFKDFETNKQ